MKSLINLVALPRKSLSWEDFLVKTLRSSIGSDGVVNGGPKYDSNTLHVNFDHHENVVREATM